jgi:hypothetical protein
MAQPTNIQGSKNSVWDELNQKWLFEEISHLSSLALNSGAGNVSTAWLDMKKNTLAQFQVVQATGTITDAVATLEHSNDGVTAVATSTTLTNAGMSAQAEVGRYVRVKFTTNSTLASTANVTIVGR